MNGMMIVCCVGAVIFSLLSHAIKLNDPIVESLDFRRFLIQLVTGMIARPLEIICFFFAFFSAFISGVLCISYSGVEFTNDRHQPAVAE